MCFTTRKRWCGQSWSNVQLVQPRQEKQTVGQEALLWNNWQRCLEHICYFHWKCAQLWRTWEREAAKIIEGAGSCFDHSTCMSEIRSATNTARCETGHSQLRHLPAPSPAPSTTQRHSAQRKRCYITLCVKSTTNRCATNARSKS